MTVMTGKDLSARIEAENVGNYYRILFTNSVQGYQRGSLKEVENVYYHNDKGCMEEPLMHVVLDSDDPYSDLFCLCDESMVESINKLINKLVQDIVWMSAELSDM